jgi:hypothetical protein
MIYCKSGQLALLLSSAVTPRCNISLELNKLLKLFCFTPCMLSAFPVRKEQADASAEVATYLPMQFA